MSNVDEPLAPPVVLAFAGSDPTGGAGIQADIGAISSMGCHPAPVITVVTVQDTREVKETSPLDPVLVEAQARSILNDMTVASIKIGLVGTVEIVDVIASVLEDYPNIPVILDPVLASGGGVSLVDRDVIDVMRSSLIPKATVVTPNSLEARKLAPEADTLDACAFAILDLGCDFVLVTGSHENTDHVINRLFSNYRLMETFTWERLPGQFHGSGCTLAAGIAGLLAHGLEPFSAIHEAQEFTWESLKHAHQLGKGQLLPNRFYWTDEDQSE